MAEEISAESTKEEVANYFQIVFNVSDEVKNNLIKENISGDILLDISDKDFKLFGIKKGPSLKIKKFIKEKKEKFLPKEIKKKITFKSNEEQLKEFFNEYLGFNGELNGLSGKDLIDLEKNEEFMIKLGLNFGQRKKLIRYIQFLEKEEFLINKQSSKEDVSIFLKLKTKLSQESIQKMDLDGKGFFLLDEEYINDLTKISEEEKESLKLAFNEIKNKLNNLRIKQDSPKEDVNKYLKYKFNFSDKFIIENEFDAESLFLLELDNIDEDFSEEEKDKLKKVIIELKEQKEEANIEQIKIMEQYQKININQEKNKDMETKENDNISMEKYSKVNQFLKSKLNFSENSINNLKLDLERFFMLEPEDVDNFTQITKEERQRLKNYLIELKSKKELMFEPNKIYKSEIHQEIKTDSESEFKPIQTKRSESNIQQEIKTNIESEINISYDSNKEEIEKFFSVKLNLDNYLIKQLNLDGEILFSLDDKDIDEFDKIPKEKREKLKNILNKINFKINEESNKNDVKKFLKINLRFQNKTIENIDLDGKKLFSLTEKDIEGIEEISKQEKESLKKFLKMNRISITKSSNEKEIIKFLKIKLKMSYKSIMKLDFDGESLLLLDEEDIDELKGITEEERQKLKQYIKNVIKPKDESHILNQNKKYNLFFIIPIKEKYIENLKVKTYIKNISSENLKKIENIIINISDYILDENKKIKLLLFQVFTNKKITNSLLIRVKNKLYKLNTKSQIETQTNDDNKNINLYTKNLFFEEKIEYFYELQNRIIFDKFLSYFINKENNIDMKYQLYFLNSILEKIKTIENLELEPETILKLFKFCCKMKVQPKNIDSIIMINNYKEEKDKKNNIIKLNKEFYITDEDIENLKIKINTSKFFILLIEIYLNFDVNYLLKLTESKNGNDYTRIVLYCLINNKNKFNLSFNIEEDLLIFQKKLISVSQTKDEVNSIIKLKKGFYNNLKFINDNFVQIYNIIENDLKNGISKNITFQVSLDKLENDENIDNIFLVLSNIIFQNEEKKYKILNYNEILVSLIYTYSNKTLEEFYKLHLIIKNLKKEKIDQKIISEFYIKFHNKGFLLIKNNSLKSEDIFDFILSKDIYYYSPIYKDSDYRDPEIFKYIIITDINKEYLKIIELIKKNKIVDIFLCNSKKKSKFYNILISQMNKIKDIQSIFEIFNIKDIDNELTSLINGIFRDLKYSLLEEKSENYEILYKIFNNWIIINKKWDLDFNFITNIIEINLDLASKYYFYLLKLNEMQLYTNILKNYIFNFFINQNGDKNKNAESLISLLLISPNDEFLIFFLNQLNKQILTEKDFYQKEENYNYHLFKLFYQKCNSLIKNQRISDGYYLKETIIIKNKIYNDLQKNNVSYNIVNNLMEEENIFYDKILVITQNKDEADKYFNKFKLNLNISKKKLEELEIIKDFYITFYNYSREKIICLIQQKITEMKYKNISDVADINIENIFNDDDELNFEEAKKESENIKYRNSLFFMAIYSKNKDNIGINTEDKIFKDTINDFKETMIKIINQKDTKEPFFEIKNIEYIIKTVENEQNDLKKEIIFIGKEFSELEKEDYIKNHLLEDLINFSKKNKIEKILQGIIEFIEAYREFKFIQLTEFMDTLKEISEMIKSNGVRGEDIKKARDFLSNFGYDINKKSTLIEFYELFISQANSIKFLKTIKEKKFDIRYLNEFIDESESSDIQTTDIDNLIYINNFFLNLEKNKNINTDEEFFKIFKIEFEKDKEIDIKLNRYLKSYGEIIQIYQLYNKNPEMNIAKIVNILNNSLIKIYKDENTNLFTFLIQYENNSKKLNNIKVKELDELRNKILMSSSNENIINEVLKAQDKKNLDRAKITKDFVNLIDNIKQLNKTLNILLKSGYFHVKNISIKVNECKVFDENDKNKDLQKIIDYYKEINKNFKNDIKEIYIKYPYLRLFYGQNFLQLYEKTKNPKIDIFSLINSVTMKNIKNSEVDYVYDNKKSELENITLYIDKLFKKNKINLDEIYNTNKVLQELNLNPGLYRKIKAGDNNNLIENIINIYQNMTKSAPIINTLLICNEDTSLEKIKSFLYRAILCDKPILFVLCNIECLELSMTQNLIKILKYLYKLRNGQINSFLLFLYENIDSGFGRDLGKLIPERNILNDEFLLKPKNFSDIFQKIDLYSSKFAGYGKTTEIIYKVKDKKGIYKYLPIGGTFTREYIINNLINLKLDLQNANNIYLHIDLSETDNADLMYEILFKLIILRTLDSNDKIFYLGYEINIIIEIPNGFIDFNKKYKLLNLFKNNYIQNLHPLRLEEGVKKIIDSPISIVAEILTLYDNNEIGTKNIDLNSEIRKSAKECEKIIDKYFKSENKNYYQKMNFIKILSVQFKKFNNDIFLKYDLQKQLGKGKIIEKARINIISNFIQLTQVFTCSPFDSIIMSENKSIEIFGKYNENKEIQDGINKLIDENKKKEIFSFDKIKPSLVFFNRDGNSISIISNINKRDKEYINLKELWNSQNNFKSEELVDYKKLNHFDFLDQIKKLFSLDYMNIEDIKKICENLDNYIFVADNFIKMVRILLNIEAKIPVILMGETGVGKTKLLEMLATLYGKGTNKWNRLLIHGGTTDKTIIDYLEKIIEKEKNGNKDENVWIFFDEINTCNSLGLITEIMCNHTYLGNKIDDRFIFLGACNPYRVMNNKMKESGLVYHNMKEDNPLNNLVYTVKPLPHSLLNFIFDFGSLQIKDEKKYIKNMVILILSKLKKDISDNQIKNITDEIVDTIIISHNFLREKYDRSSVSLRDIRRFGIFFEYFLKDISNNNQNKDYEKLKESLNMALYLCYYLRINDKQYRKELSQKLKKFFYKDFIFFPEQQIRKLTRKMLIEKGKGIALNRALRENLFTCFTCIENTIPIIIVGKPGTGKSLSFQILFNTLKGENSENRYFRNKGKLYRFYYQGSKTSTSEGIEKVFDNALKAKNESKNSKNIYLVFFDEMGLAERSSNNPLKVIHNLLERDKKDMVPFLGISNWRLDAAKINRALNLSITDYDIEDLEETAYSIAEAIDENLCNKYKDFFKTLSRVYGEYIKELQNSLPENKDFHGNRDFYNLIKTSMKELMMKEEELNKNENKVLTEVGLISLCRNFGGLEKLNIQIIEIFKKLFQDKYNESVNLTRVFSVLDTIKKNVNESDSRYLMLISEGNDATEITKYLLETSRKKYIELVGSKYKTDIKSGGYSEEILNKIKYIMETDNVLILRNLDMIYPSLYDLFNQNFTIIGDKKYARLAFGYAKISSEVNRNFHIIVIINSTQIKNLKLDPPFLNRFEKHIISYDNLLEEKDKQIANKIVEYLSLISSFNNNKDKLKINLKKLFINCEIYNIEGLIFKIKSDLFNKVDKENKEHWIFKDGIIYEENMTKEILLKIVPTFCHDIIIAMIILEKNLEKYNKIKNIVLTVYKNINNNKNFESFFRKIESRQNIIYTFSKITENLLDEEIEREIENKFGKFTCKSFNNEIIESIKEENELIFLLKSFANSKDKKVLVLHFTEKDLDKMNSIKYVINNFEKEIQNLNDKLIIFLVHKQRNPILKKEIIPDLIPFIDDNFNQIFIDNLQGKENLNILEIMQKKNEDFVKEYIENSDFIENKIFKILNYINFTVLYETEKINKKNYTNVICEKIINNKYIKKLLLNNLKQQGKSIKAIIESVFTNNIIEINDVDFFEVINSYLGSYFSGYLLNIIYYSFKDFILNLLLINSNFDLIIKEEYFNKLISDYFEKTKFDGITLYRNINANKITIYNNLELPTSKKCIESLINYIENNIVKSYLINEESLRKIIKKDKEEFPINNYNKNMEKIKMNLEREINKFDLLKFILYKDNNELKKILFNDYFVYYVIKYTQKKEIHYDINPKILNFLKLIIKISLIDRNNYELTFNYSFEEFIDILLFTQGYKEDIKSILDIFVELQKYFNNIDEQMMKIINENNINFVISGRNQPYIKIVNNRLFYLFESFIRAILILSKTIINDEMKFFEFFYSLNLIEACLQKINKKFRLSSKEIYGLRYIIKIGEAFQNNQGIFFQNYEKLIDNILPQSILYYNQNYNNLYIQILDLINILDEVIKEKNEEYLELLFFIYRVQYKNIYSEDIQIKLAEKFFQNNYLLKKSKLFLVDNLKIIKPIVFDKNNEKIKKTILVDNFLNLKISNYLKIQNLINIINKINSNEFNEILLFFFEQQCQSYFMTILKNNKNIYNQNCCEELLLDVSLEYLKKAIKYLYENKNNNNNLLKLYAIAYIKTYCYYYVEINYKKFDIVNWDLINNILYDKDEQNILISKMRNLYIWRLYSKKFDNFTHFKAFNFGNKKISIYKQLSLQLEEERNKTKYIFKNSFINPNKIETYKKLSHNYDEQKEINYEDFNDENKFDLFYSFIVNKIISYLFSKDKIKVADEMTEIYQKTKNIFKFNDEGKKLYEYLLNYHLYQENIENKISYDKLKQNEFEILLYSLRFIFNTQINNKDCFYNNILKSNTYDFITNNYIPGAYSKNNLYEDSYYILKDKLINCSLNKGYYICKDCGFFYEIPYPTFPKSKNYCPNNHIIGGENYICSKKDIRVFASKGDQEILAKKWKKHSDYLNSFEKLTIDEYKEQFIDKKIKMISKGITNIDIIEFEKTFSKRNINIFTFRILNFILYSYFLGSYILGNITNNQILYFIVDGILPKTLFGVIKKNWELLESFLKMIGIENNQTFLNIIFDELCIILRELKVVNNEEELFSFEKKVDDLIMSKISRKVDRNKLNKDYQDYNNILLNLDPYCLEEIILGNYDPSIYNQEIYPDIQYYTLSNIPDFYYFANKFNSSKENKEKYFLINILINKDDNLAKNIISLKYLEAINTLSNLLLLIYSYKISRKEAKAKTLKDEITNIIKEHNLINIDEINNDNDFIEKYLNPFFKSWQKIKSQIIQYKSIKLIDIKKGEKPLDMNINLPLSYFLVDDANINGGMFLASAYEKMIKWQNDFIDIIIKNNKLSGIHNSYVSQLEQEIDVQDATKDEIINIDDKLYNTFNDLIYNTTMRNIFSKDNKINYKNYNDFIYNYEYIEQELGRLILPGIKKFKKDKIKFVTYLYEAFKDNNNNILTMFNKKFKQRKLNEEEEKRIEELSRYEKSTKFHNEIFSSLQILMNEIKKENYDSNTLIYTIINNLPDYIILNKELKNMFKETYEYFMEEIMFSIDSLVSIFEYFEAICWEEIKKNINKNYQLKMTEKTKKYFEDYFKFNKDKNKLINVKNFTMALRKLISRSLTGIENNSEIDPKSGLYIYIFKIDLWPNEFKNDNNINIFYKEIDFLRRDNIIIGNCFDLYMHLNGDKFLKEEIERHNKKYNEIKKEYEMVEFKEDNKNNSENENKISDGEEDEADKLLEDYDESDFDN